MAYTYEACLEHCMHIIPINIVYNLAVSVFNEIRYLTKHCVPERVHVWPGNCATTVRDR